MLITGEQTTDVEILATFNMFSGMYITDMSTGILTSLSLFSGIDTYTFEYGKTYDVLISTESGSPGNGGSFGFTEIPAPSALALLGLAGVATRRRRK